MTKRRFGEPDWYQYDFLLCYCGHLTRDHSHILEDGPCLDCDCPAFMEDAPPNPFQRCFADA